MFCSVVVDGGRQDDGALVTDSNGVGIRNAVTLSVFGAEVHCAVFDGVHCLCGGSGQSPNILVAHLVDGSLSFVFFFSISRVHDSANEGRGTNNEVDVVFVGTLCDIEGVISGFTGRDQLSLEGINGSGGVGDRVRAKTEEVQSRGSRSSIFFTPQGLELGSGGFAIRDNALIPGTFVTVEGVIGGDRSSRGSEGRGASKTNLLCVSETRIRNIGAVSGGGQIDKIAIEGGLREVEVDSHTGGVSSLVNKLVVASGSCFSSTDAFELGERERHSGSELSNGSLGRDGDNPTWGGLLHGGSLVHVRLVEELSGGSASKSGDESSALEHNSFNNLLNYKDILLAPLNIAEKQSLTNKFKAKILGGSDLAF